MGDDHDDFHDDDHRDDEDEYNDDGDDDDCDCDKDNAITIIISFIILSNTDALLWFTITMIDDYHDDYVDKHHD